MNQEFVFSHFRSRFPTNERCLEEIKKLRYPNGVYCNRCNKVTKHYKITGRTAYSCKVCRNHIYPLAGTVFEKTTTPLSLLFYAMFLLTHTKATISIKQLQKELGVTYKTAWRMYRLLKRLMAQNNEDLLAGQIEFEKPEKIKVHKWVFFNTFEISLTQKDSSEEKG